MAGYNYNLRSIIQTAKNVAQTEILVPARVVDVILDNSHPEFERYGRWASIGAVKYRVLNRDIDESNPQNLPIAFPLQSHIKHVPLKNEIILVVSSPSELLDESSNNVKNYYLDIVNLWNHPHHNGFPDNTEQDIELGNEFTEASDVNPMLPFEGDVIVEGRFGNSLRFGSTNSGTKVITKPGTPVNSSEQYPVKLTFNSGDSNTVALTSLLANVNLKVQTFRAGKTNTRLSTIVRASESQVTNPDNLAKGELAEKRLENALTTLNQFPLINKNLQKEALIGSTSYRRGVDDPNDSRYTAEQFVEVIVIVSGTELTSPTQVTIPVNTWSTEGSTTGFPITIISNGQVTTDQGYEYIVEDINQDFSSLYLTSNQKIPVDSTQQFSLFAPIEPNLYEQSQFIGNSDRVLLNGRDSILGTAANQIGLKATDVYLEGTSNVGINAPKIQLGNTNTQPVLKGDDTVALLKSLISELRSLGTILTLSASPTTVVNLADAGTSLVERAISLEGRLEQIKSKKTFTE